MAENDKIILTVKEQKFLHAMAAARATRESLAGGPEWDSPDSLIKGGYLPPDSPVAGLHQTAASLVRKGMIVKSTRSGLMHYQLTAAGSAADTISGGDLDTAGRSFLVALTAALDETGEPWHSTAALMRLGYLPAGSTDRSWQKTARGLVRRGLAEQGRQFGAAVYRATASGGQKIMDTSVDSAGAP